MSTTTTWRTSFIASALIAIGALAGSARPAAAAERLCDPGVEDCRAQLLTLINNENVEIDVAYWFMNDSRYSTAIMNRWKAGVAVRVLLDPRGDRDHSGNATIRQAFADAGIPIRYRTASGILHWKTMLFAGQNVVQFSGANYGPFELTPVTPYSNYEDEAIYFSDDPAVVNSFKTKWDDLWTDTSSYANYANITNPLTRHYPTYPIDPELNFPPGQDYANRSVDLYNHETQQIDATMFRITDRRHTDAIINAMGRGVKVRLLTEQEEYRNPERLWDSWNVDRMWAAGAEVRQRAHEGLIHQKSVILYGQATTIFGSSNWTSPSANSQQEHNYFTTKSWIFQWFVDQFNRKWNNTGGAPETEAFAPLPPDKPWYVSPGNAATGRATSGVVLTWYGGPWAHIYDVYFGTNPNPPLLAAEQNLGPSRSAGEYQSFALPTLTAGTTYYWRVVSKTMAGQIAAGPVWSFTTTGTPPPPPPPPSGATTQVMWTSNVPSSAIHGNWIRTSDASAAGGAALANTDRGAGKITPALVTPANYFETTFSATSGTAYHLWVRLRAQGNSFSNDSVHVQFSDSVDSFGSPVMRIGTTSSAEIVLEDGATLAPDHGWGWSENGWGSLGPDVYFAATGTHTLRVQQREDGAIVDQIVLSPDTYLRSAPGPRQDDATILPSTDGSTGGGGGGGGGGPLPSPWLDQDVGAVGLAGSARYDSTTSTFSVQASGADVWNTSDAFHFVYRTLSGDGVIQARVASLGDVNVWSKAGVMIRDSLNASSAHAFMLVSAERGVAFQWRPAIASSSQNVSGSSAAAPRWVRLSRSGDQITGFESADGSTWSAVTSQTIPMGATVDVGLAVTSHDNTQLTTATFDHVSVTSGLPGPYADRDIGAVGVPGSAGYDSSAGAFTVSASGADVWGTADSFHFLYQPLTGDGSIVARVASLEDVNRWAKAGVMIRDELTAASAHGFMLVSAEQGVAFQRRPTAGGESVHTAGSSSAAPRWVRLVRSGNTLTGYESSDGTTWTLVGSDTIPMTGTVYIGLAVTSHDNTRAAAATFDGVNVSTS